MGTKLHLRTIATIWVVAALVIGILCGAYWLQSNRKWSDHLTHAYSAGVEAYYTLESGGNTAEVQTSLLSNIDKDSAGAGRFEQISGVSRPAYVTLLSLRNAIGNPTSISGTKIAVVSGRMQYRVAEIASGTYSSPALQFGELTRLLATYCSDPVIFAKSTGRDWVRIDGTAVWGCDAAPSDYRIGVSIVLLLTLAILITQIGNTTEAFERFSRQLLARKHVGGPDSYETTGPRELSEIVSTVNSYLEEERDQLNKRAIILSGVSHDLGTPATRLRLRATLIEDPTIREKLEADIDQMTGIIESVLTYTRSELNSEEPQKLSLTSLIEALVADYQDTDHPVSLEASTPLQTKADRSIFAPRSGNVAVGDTSKLLMYGRPIALRRAISNLIDNALKYGRRASVSVQSDSNWAIVTVEDEGGESSAAEMEQLLNPFARGDNTQTISGFGLGLTIVATVARQHGGRIDFEDGRAGVVAKLWLQRS